MAACANNQADNICRVAHPPRGVHSIVRPDTCACAGSISSACVYLLQRPIVSVGSSILHSFFPHKEIRQVDHSVPVVVHARKQVVYVRFRGQIGKQVRNLFDAKRKIGEVVSSSSARVEPQQDITFAHDKKRRGCPLQAFMPCNE